MRFKDFVKERLFSAVQIARLKTGVIQKVASGTTFDFEPYVVRNERIPELAIYSFEAGERFEPDFLLFVRKRKTEGNLIYQGYVEPKGSYLLDGDFWKEEFSLRIEDNHTIKGIYTDEYKIIGFPFFNKGNRIVQFEIAINSWLEKL